MTLPNSVGATSHTVYDFLVQLLKEKGAIPEPEAMMAYRYLANGHIDSLAFIKFIFRIEEQFGIQFTESEMIGDRVKTVGELIALIEEKLRQS